MITDERYKLTLRTLLNRAKQQFESAKNGNLNESEYHFGLLRKMISDELFLQEADNTKTMKAKDCRTFRIISD